VGPGHVGLGLDYTYPSDFNEEPPGFEPDHWWPADAGYPAGLDTGYMAPEQFGAIIAALRARGFGNAEIAGIMGANMLRVASLVWGE
ncbi:MAG: membrane dipeptidase, partial [Hyphomicrobiales bacterium]